ncbi:MAG: biopolymer transporter ExbD [Phycisphaerales bacterium]|jgi:biopolymer transport protein ExbD|nr:biopolymer transporter ExbD [Phycisphaerales bacterium]
MNLRRSNNVRERDDETLPLTSMIDVVFLLLIFFLLTASIMPQESVLASALQAERRGSGAAADLQPQIVNVVMTEAGPRFKIGTRELKSKPSLAVVLRELPKEGGVFVRVSGAAPVSAAAEALQACKDAGFRRVSYVPAK